MRRLVLVLAILATAAAGLPPALAQTPAAPAETALVSRDCPVSSSQAIAQSPLPNITQALKERRKIKILTIGASSSASRDPDRGYYGLIESYLEKAIKGLDVEIIDRGVSGELARDAAGRIQFEVALNGADLVLWQVGTFDAMAQVPAGEFEQTLTDMAQWLKSHNVDLVLVGLHYLRGFRTDARYQAIREVIRRVALKENVLRIGRYEVGEIVDKARAADLVPPDEFQLTEEGYSCMAELAARALTTGLLAKRAPEATPKPNGEH